MKDQVFLVSTSQLRQLRELAEKAQELNHSEVCGLLLSEDGRRLELLHLPNQSLRPGRWEVKKHVYESQKRRARRAGKAVAGTFHSHPISDAIPGPRDLKGSSSNSLMLIYDVCGSEARLWRMDTSKGRYQAREVAIDSTSGTARRRWRTTSISMFEGSNAKTVVIHSYKKGRSILSFGWGFNVHESPAPTWRVVDSKGNIYTLDALLTKAGCHKKSVVVPSYVNDIAKVQVYCAWGEAVVGEARFHPPIAGMESRT